MGVATSAEGTEVVIGIAKDTIRAYCSHGMRVFTASEDG